MSLHALNPAHTVFDLAAHVAAFFVRHDPRRPHDDDVAHYATQTFRCNTDGQLVLVAETPQLTYGELRGKS